jgi:hypothetical protein
LLCRQPVAWRYARIIRNNRMREKLRVWEKH